MKLTATNFETVMNVPPLAIERTLKQVFPVLENFETETDVVLHYVVRCFFPHFS